MLHVDLTLQAARDRQAALRASRSIARPSRPNALRRQLGVWIVRVGRAVAGRTAPRARLA